MRDLTLAPPVRSGAGGRLAAAMLATAGVLAPGALGAQAPVIGTVRDAVTGLPLAGVEVGIPEFGLVAATDSGGRFRLVVPGGVLLLRARLIGYAPETRSLSVVVRDTIHLDLDLAQIPQELPELEARGEWHRRWARGFDQRRKEGFGRFVTEDVLRKSEHRRLIDLLRQRGARTRIIGGRSVLVGRSLCPMAVFFDGIPLYLPPAPSYGGAAAAGPSPPNLDDWQVSEFEAIEFYNGPSETPWEFGFTGTACGVLLLWTRFR
ncbi:MAG: carboxypeptidase regulatory-like domain-containing protein [Gemmatimonadales bacterium]